MSARTFPVRPELVEGLSFFMPHGLWHEEEGQGFDKLSPNGMGCEVAA
jgi:hypothetical protein